MAQHWTNSATTTLNGGITSGATSLVVNTGDGALFPSSFPFRLRIDNEIIEVGARSTDTCSSLTRGMEGTTAASHSSGAAVKGVLTAGQLAMFHQTGVAELTAADFATPPALSQIASTVLGSTAATITFTSIPGTYTNLMLIIFGRGNPAANFTGITMVLNSDTGADYDVQNFNAENGTVAASNSLAQTSAAIGYLTGSTSVANRAGSIQLTLFGYAQTTFNKTFIAQSFLDEGDSAGQKLQENYFGDWRGTAAVTSITLGTSGGSFIAGTTATLYGLS